MKCRCCGNTRSFLVEGKELRLLNKDDPYEIETFFVPTKSVCANSSCPGFPCSDVELDPVHPDLAAFADVFGLSH